MKYLLEYKWGKSEPQMHEVKEIETDDINYTIKQIGRHRPFIEFLKVKQIK